MNNSFRGNFSLLTPGPKVKLTHRILEVTLGVLSEWRVFAHWKLLLFDLENVPSLLRTGGQRAELTEQH